MYALVVFYCAFSVVVASQISQVVSGVIVERRQVVGVAEYIYRVT